MAKPTKTTAGIVQKKKSEKSRSGPRPATRKGPAHSHIRRSALRHKPKWKKRKNEFWKYLCLFRRQKQRQVNYKNEMKHKTSSEFLVVVFAVVRRKSGSGYTMETPTVVILHRHCLIASACGVLKHITTAQAHTQRVCRTYCTLHPHASEMQLQQPRLAARIRWRWKTAQLSDCVRTLYESYICIRHSQTPITSYAHIGKRENQITVLRNKEEKSVLKKDRNCQKNTHTDQEWWGVG